MTAEPLKPCPFCGGNVGIGRMGHQWDTDPCYIVCDGCNMVFEITEHSHSIKEITDAWNRRAESIGNSDEIPEWLLRKLIFKRSSLSQYDVDDCNFRNALEWVLSLKKEGK